MFIYRLHKHQQTNHNQRLVPENLKLLEMLAISENGKCHLLFHSENINEKVVSVFEMVKGIEYLFSIQRNRILLHNYWLKRLRLLSEHWKYCLHRYSIFKNV